MTKNNPDQILIGVYDDKFFQQLIKGV